MPARRKVQIHLGTALILLFVAAGLLWLNLEPHYSHKPWLTAIYGWPFSFLGLNPPFIEWGQKISGSQTWRAEFFSLLKFFTNITVAFGVLVATAIGSEFFLYRAGRSE